MRSDRKADKLLHKAKRRTDAQAVAHDRIAQLVCGVFAVTMAMELLLLGVLLVGGYFLLHATYLKLPRCKSTAKLQGKTAIVTGEYVSYAHTFLTST